MASADHTEMAFIRLKAPKLSGGQADYHHSTFRSRLRIREKLAESGFVLLTDQEAPRGSERERQCPVIELLWRVPKSDNLVTSRFCSEASRLHLPDASTGQVMERLDELGFWQVGIEQSIPDCDSNV